MGLAGGSLDLGLGRDRGGAELDRRRQRLRRRLRHERHQRRRPVASSTCSTTARSKASRTSPARPSRSTRSARISTTRCARRCTRRACRRTPPTSSSCPARSSSRCCAPARSTSPPSATGRPPSRARRASTAASAPIFDDTDVLGEIAGGFVVLRRDWVDAHPEQARIFVEQSARALDYAREHPEETKAIFAKALEERGENPEVAQYFRGYGVREGGLPVLRDIQFWIDVLRARGPDPQGQARRRGSAARDRRRRAGDELMSATGEVLRGEVTVRDLTKSFALNGHDAQRPARSRPRRPRRRGARHRRRQRLGQDHAAAGARRASRRRTAARC